MYICVCVCVCARAHMITVLMNSTRSWLYPHSSKTGNNGDNLQIMCSKM